MNSLKPVLSMLFLISLTVSACSPGLLFQPAQTPPTNTLPPMVTATGFPTVILTATPAATLALQPTQNPTQIMTLTPTTALALPPGDTVLTSYIINVFSDAFTFSEIPAIGGKPAFQGITGEGYSTITLIGDPHLEKAVLRVDLSNEAQFPANAYWIQLLEVTSHGGKPAADWIKDTFPRTINANPISTVIGNATLILESNQDGSLFLLTVIMTENP